MFSVLAASLLLSNLIHGAVGGCCFPPQQESKAELYSTSVQNGVMKTLRGQIQSYFDLTINKQRNDLTVDSGEGATTITYIDDYDVTPNVRYQIQGNACKTVPNPPPKYSCIPDHVVPTAQVQIGAPNHSLHANVYDIHVGSEPVRLWVDDNCVGISQQTQFNINDQRYVMMISYYDVKLNIQNSSVFDIPSICKQHQAPINV